MPLLINQRHLPDLSETKLWKTKSTAVNLSSVQCGNTDYDIVSLSILKLFIEQVLPPY